MHVLQMLPVLVTVSTHNAVSKGLSITRLAVVSKVSARTVLNAVGEGHGTHNGHVWYVQCEICNSQNNNSCTL